MRTTAVLVALVLLYAQCVASINLRVASTVRFIRNTPVSKLAITADTDIPVGAQIVFRTLSSEASACSQTGNHVANTHFTYVPLTGFVFSDANPDTKVYGVPVAGKFKLCYSSNGQTWETPGSQDPTVTCAAPGVAIYNLTSSGGTTVSHWASREGPKQSVAVGTAVSVSVGLEAIRAAAGLVTVTPVKCDRVFFVPKGTNCFDTFNSSSSPSTEFGSTFPDVTFANSGTYSVCFQPSNYAVGYSGSCSSFTNPASGIPNGQYQVEVTAARLSAPNGLSITSTTPSTIVLSWTNMAEATVGYRIRYTGHGVTDYQAVLFPGRTTATLTGLLPNTLYYISIQGENSAGPGTYSTVVNGSTTVYPSRLKSVVASGPGSTNGDFGAGDTVTFTFDADTTRGGEAIDAIVSQSTVSSWITFPAGEFFASPGQGNFTGKWFSSSVFIITIGGVAAQQAAPSQGGLYSFTSGVFASGSVAVASNTQMLVGNWGTPGVTVPAEIIANQTEVSLSAIQITPINASNTIIGYAVANSSVGLIEYRSDGSITPLPQVNISSSATSNTTTLNDIMQSVVVSLAAGAVANNSAVVLTVSKYEGARGSETHIFSAQVLLKVPQRNRPPVVVVANLPTIVKQAAAQAIAALTIADVDEAVGSATVFTVSLNIAGPAKLQFSSYADADFSRNTASIAVSLSCTIANCNTALAKMQLVVDNDARVGATIAVVYKVEDGGTPLGSVGGETVYTLSCAAGAVAPTLQETVWLTGNQVAVKFSAPIYTMSTTQDCSHFFNSATIAVFGSNPRCLVNGQVIDVYLGTGASLNTGDNVVLKADVIKACAAATGFTPTGNSAVQAPAIIVVPQVTVFGTENVDACTDAKVGWVLSNLGGRAAAVSVTGTAVAGLTVAAGATSLVIPNGNLTTGANSITVSASNWLGASASQTFVITKTANAPLVRIVGNSVRTVHVASVVDVVAVAYPSACDTTSTISFAWTTSPSINTTSQAGRLRIAPNVLTTVDVTVTVTATKTGGASTTASVVLKPGHLDVKAIILGGSRVTQATTSTLVLDATKSTDGRSYVDTSLATFAWSCRRLDDNSPTCYNVSDDRSVISLGSSATLSHDAANFDIGEAEFTLTVTLGSSVATTRQVVVFVDGARPLVRVVGPSFIGANDALALRLVTAGLPSAWVRWEYLWSVSDDTVAASAAFIAAKTSFDLVLNARTDTVFVPGRTYSFSLTATDREASPAVSGDATFSLTVRAPPQGGSVAVSPSTGTALQTAFVLSTSDWVENKEQEEFVEYQFFYTNADGARVPLGPPSTESSLRVKYLPAGSPLTVGAVARVRGAFDDKLVRLQGVAYANVTVATGTVTTNLINQVGTDYARTMDSNGVVQSIASIADTARGGNTGLSQAQRQELVMQIDNIKGSTSEAVGVDILKSVLNTRDGTAKDSDSTINTARGILEQYSTSSADRDLNFINNFMGCIPPLFSHYIALSKGSSDYVALSHPDPVPKSHGRSLLALSASDIEAAEQTALLTRNEMKQAASLLTAQGETWTYDSPSSGLSAHVRKSLGSSALGYAFGNVSMQDPAFDFLDSSLAAELIAVHLLYIKDNPFPNTLLNPATSAPATDVVLRSALLDVRVTKADLTYVSNFSKNVNLVFALSSDVTCTAPDCTFHCARYDSSADTWVTTKLTTLVTSSSTVSCETSEAGTVAAFTIAGPGTEDSTEEFVGSWKFYAVIGAGVILILMVGMCCCLFHKPHLDPTIKKMASKRNLAGAGGAGAPQDFHSMSPEEKKQHIVDHPASGQHKEIHEYEHHEVQHLARQWTQFFREEHSQSGAPQNQDQFIAVQLTAQEQARTPGGPTPGGP